MSFKPGFESRERVAV